MDPEVFGGQGCQGTRNSQRPEGYLRPAVQWPSSGRRNRRNGGRRGRCPEKSAGYTPSFRATQIGKMWKNAVLLQWI